MRRTLVAVPASLFWLACGGDDVGNAFDGSDTGAGGHGGAAGMAGQSADAATDRAATGGGSGVDTGGGGGARDGAAPDADAHVPVDVASDSNTSCSDDNGCATNFACDTGLGICVPATSPKCTDYCNTIQAACATAYQQYPSVIECLHSCAPLPRTDAVSTNTIKCRLSHAQAAQLVPVDPYTHCPHAGPAGDAVCGGNCESFCTLAAAACPTVYSQFSPDCITACNGFAMARYFEPMGAAGGNTFACRMYHLTLATVDPVSHCSHIAVASPVCK
jgi:hypothetical protein